MSGAISVLVYGDCPELQDCDVELEISNLALSNSHSSFEQRVRGFDLALVVVGKEGRNALQCIRYLRQVNPGGAILMVAEAAETDLVCEALQLGVTDYVLRAGARQEMVFLLNHHIERLIGQRHLKRRFHESERRFWTFFDHSPLGLVIMGLDGRCEHANPAFCDLAGLGAEDLRSRRLADLSMVEDGRIWESLRKELVSESRDFARLEIQLDRDDGERRWMHLTALTMSDAQGEPSYLLGMAVDKTRRKKIQQNLAQADKMQAMGRLAGGVAHDFNNLLTIINSHCFIMDDVCDQAHKDPERLKWSLERIRTATDRGARLTRQLLTFGRHRRTDTEVFDPNERIENMRVVLESLFGKSVRVHLALGERLPEIDINPSEFEQVVMNLALNARDAMEEGGKFTVCTYELDVKVPSSAVPAELPRGRYSVLEVSDNGSGMSAEVQRQAFEPFYTTKEVGQGTGLGLSTVYGVVNRNEGHISIDSELGRGTTFTIYFPAARHESETPQKLRRARKATPTDGNETILLVEDEGELREPLLKLLTDKGYDVIAAANAEEALIISTEFPGTIDLLLTDVIMPGIDGVSLADSITADRPETAVILMSGYTAETLAIGSRANRERRMLQKPFGMDILSRTIRNVLQTR